MKVNEAETAKCPQCGGDYLVKTGYCMKCKKKVSDMKGGKKKEEVIEIVTEFTVPGTDIILEAGDKIMIQENASEDYTNIVDAIDNMGINYLPHNIDGFVQELFETVLDGVGNTADQSGADLNTIMTKLARAFR